MIGLKTEKAIKRVMEYNRAEDSRLAIDDLHKKNGDVVFVFTNANGEQLAKFSLSQIISKRYPKRKKK